MIKKIVLSGVSLLSLAGVAAAADLPARMAPPVYAPPLPIFTWSGAYFGINAGYAFGHEGQFKTTTVAPGLNTRNQTTSNDGFTGGGQIGYNYQIAGTGIVLGIEADAAYTDLDRTRTLVYGFDGGRLVLDGAALGPSITNYRSSLDYLGTVRGRVGYAFNQFLIYGTGGFAYGGVDNRVSVQGVPGGPILASGRRSTTETGYAWGGGVEYALPTGSFLNFFRSSAVTLKAEYLHYDLGRSNVAINTGAANVANSRVSNDGDLVRVGLNYKFGAY